MSLVDFLGKCQKKYGELYDYSAVEYKNSQSPVTIICRTHGPFQMRPAAHLHKQGCPTCGRERSASLRRTSVASFVERASTIHKGEYDYSQVIQPPDNKTKVTIICKKHGAFAQSFNAHLGGTGCPGCGAERAAGSRRSNFVEFLEKARKVHGDKYDYSLTEYKGSETKVKIRCKACDSLFEQAPHNHINQKQGCPDCGRRSSERSRRKDQDKFISEAVAIHGDTYIYDLVQYEGANNNVTIICREHGEFLQRPAQHLKGQGCRKCGITRRTQASRNTTEWFTAEARKVHGDRFDYTNTTYTTSADKVTYICEDHGEVTVLPYDHLKGIGCPTCSHTLAGERRRTSFREFMVKAFAIHEGRYSYIEDGFIDSKTPANILCHVHGVFQQQPNSHLGGHGCKACSGSNGENSMAEFLWHLGVNVVRWDRTILDGFELDFYLPDQNLAIEYNGLRYHSSWADEHRGRDWVRNHQKWKQEQCAKKGIRLLHYYEDEWINRRAAVTKQLSLALGRYDGPRHYARQTKTTWLPWADAKDFMDLHHLQGAPMQGTSYGLEVDDKIVAVMIFAAITSKRGEKACPSKWELVRYASDGQVVGGASKLLAAFVKHHPEAREVVSYSDNRWASGDVYRRLGFTEDSQVPVDYMYIKTSTVERFHKSNFRRSALAKKYPDQFDPALSERENCHKLGFYQIFNCGLTKWVRHFQS